MLTLFCRHSSHIKHLEAEVAFWRQQFAHERNRAEHWTNVLLALKVGAPPPVPTREEQSEAERELEEQLRDPEFAQAGRVE